MARQAATLDGRSIRRGARRSSSSKSTAPLSLGSMIGVCLLVLVGLAAHGVMRFWSLYTVSWQSPVRLHWQLPIVIAHRVQTKSAVQARADQQGRPLTAYQQYTCEKFGPACRVALAIQRAENVRGHCEIYHYNSDGTLDWGYFQINTVHLKRPGLNLRDLLDCRANIDFAYQLYQERGFTAWSTYNSGAYLRFLQD